MHPSRAIRGVRSELLSGRRIVLGVSGSIAAIETPRIIRELIRHGAEVRAVMSPEAARLVTPESLQFATGHPPVQQLTGDVEHVTWLGPGEGRADLLLIAPATANTISKIAHGIDDTPVTSFASVALGGGIPVLIAPAMHAHMGQNPAIRENLAKLVSWGVGIIASASAEGEEKLATPEEVAAAVLHRLGRGPIAGRSVVVVGGAGRESIDAVRSVTNESSGETAVALATQAHFRGAEVELWAGSMQVPIPSFLTVSRWRSSEDLLGLLKSRSRQLSHCDLVLVPAALPDYTLRPVPGKISSRERPELTLTLTRAPKVLPELRRRVPPRGLVVGFKLESGLTTDDLAAAARRLREESDLDFVVANDRSSMGSPTTSVLVLDRAGRRHWLQGPKTDVAGKLLDDLGREVGHRALAAGAGGTATSRPHRAPRRARARSRAR
ncbi:MAG TPA: bifunctional phosphopantothenoylcysteine decarboxylase/phosphopantothenate--cysteine ligase CoaBC [Thermoplasmata archaeon]|nr:bifunctional phosphopantothenoylcysteine decarboxylase/phosphopantothenate--cysteine ligase CoaBC [Thermoplasmata archaeon]